MGRRSCCISNPEGFRCRARDIRKSLDWQSPRWRILYRRPSGLSPGCTLRSSLYCRSLFSKMSPRNNRQNCFKFLRNHPEYMRKCQTNLVTTIFSALLLWQLIQFIINVNASLAWCRYLKTFQRTETNASVKIRHKHALYRHEIKTEKVQKQIERKK